MIRYTPTNQFSTPYPALPLSKGGGKVRDRPVYLEGFRLRLQIDITLADLRRYLILCSSDTIESEAGFRSA
jgi:hypothetical protein